MSTLGIFRQLLQPSWCQASCSALFWIPLARPRGGSCRLRIPGPLYISHRHAPWRVSLHSRFTATAQREMQQFTGYESISIGKEKRTPLDAFEGGEFTISHWTVKPGSPLSVKVLSRHDPPASVVLEIRLFA